jgi:hypothetical protein
MFAPFCYDVVNLLYSCSTNRRARQPFSCYFTIFLQFCTILLISTKNVLQCRDRRKSEKCMGVELGK